ncbi:uncharacterized protein LOC126323721 [Schistocerca gregaria]|uniref:uncharacterized protein LOC126323721 n=1 Tax=Schistocerca gregaria TaxID=7010 RepID=UPI00211DC424|nr:uncharacterized protein LOC126323721 [Schistocerca gregaria]
MSTDISDCESECGPAREKDLIFKKKYISYKKKACKLKAELKEALERIDVLVKQKQEYYDELQTLKGAISVYNEQKRIPYFSDLSHNNDGDEEFTDDIEKFDKVRYNDDMNVRLPSWEAKKMREANTQGTELAGTMSEKNKRKSVTASDDSYSHIYSDNVNQPRVYVDKASSRLWGIPSRKYSTARNLKRELMAEESLKPVKQEASEVPETVERKDKISENHDDADADVPKLASRSSSHNLLSLKRPASVSPELTSKPDVPNLLPKVPEGSVLSEDHQHQKVSDTDEYYYAMHNRTPEDQPTIFDEGTVRDILCGLGITSSRHFDDSLLIPDDYSYSYQFKVNRTPQKLLKFKDFAPKVFHQIRQHWNVTSADILLSFRYDNLDAIRGEGKSGAFFIFTRDKRFILKTATGPERNFLWEILPFYFLYIRKNPNTCLPRFYGVYSMKHEGIGGMVRFVIMNNCFDSLKPVETYDLKGSTVGRRTVDPKPGDILKDLDIRRKFYFEEGMRKTFLKQLQLDATFLAEHNVMDYSLLVGIYYDSTGKESAFKSHKGRFRNRDEGFRSKFQEEYGGIPGVNPETGEKEIYYCGIIDILQRYNGRKKLEHFFKSIPYNPDTISIVEPVYYAKRFLNFISNVICVKPEVAPSQQEEATVQTE